MIHSEKQTNKLKENIDLYNDLFQFFNLDGHKNIQHERHGLGHFCCVSILIDDQLFQHSTTFVFPDLDLNHKDK